MPIVVLSLLAFIVYGLTEGVRGVTWPSVALTFGIPSNRLGVLLAVIMTGSLCLSFSSGRIIKAIGLARSVRCAIYLVSTGAVMVALSPTFTCMLACGFIMGAGGGLLDASLNALFTKRFSESAMSWLHAAFGVGTTIGPLLVQQIFLHDASWRFAYVVISAAALLALTGFLLAEKRMQRIVESDDGAAFHDAAPMASTLRERKAWLGIALFFTYAGIEITTGEWAYTVLLYRGVDPISAAAWLSGYWGAFTVGRIANAAFAGMVSQRMIVPPAMVGVLFSATAFAFGGHPTVWIISLAGLGLFLAPIFPAIMFDTQNRVAAPHVNNAVGLQIAASTIGWAAMPGIAGAIAAYSTWEAIPIFVVCTSAVVLAIYRFTALRERAAPTAPVMGS